MPDGYLACFRDLLAMDATVLRLHDLLGRSYATSRTNQTNDTGAAAKLHMVMSVIDGSPTQVGLTSERVHDTGPWGRVGRWVRDRLLLFDLGYYSFHLFDRIDQNPPCQGSSRPVLVRVAGRWPAGGDDEAIRVLAGRGAVAALGRAGVVVLGCAAPCRP